MDPSELSEQLFAREPRPALPFALYVLWSDDPAAELARELERLVFLQAFGNTPQQLRMEYGPFDRASLFLMVLDVERRAPAGMIRIITESPHGPKTIADLERVWGVSANAVVPHPQLLRGTATWDIATLAVHPEYRGRLYHSVSGALYQAICTIGVRNGIRWITAVFDVRVLRLLQTSFRRPFSPFHGVEPRSYLGSPASLAVWCDGEAFRERLRRSDPPLHAFMFEGAGLERFVSQPCWQLSQRETD
jgi:hypothetical protein